MPYLKCEPCRARVRVHSAATDRGLQCPLCDEPLVPVDDLAEVLDFRTVTFEPTLAGPEAGHQRIANAVNAVLAERRHRRARGGDDRFTTL